MLAIGIITAFALKAQNFDMNAIEVDVKLHPEQYRELLQRFERCDTTLTPSELSTVYFGYSYTPNYVPFESFANVQEAYDSGDYTEAEKLAREDYRHALAALIFGAVAEHTVPHTSTAP